MKQAIAQETLAALVETGVGISAAAGRGSLAPGAAPRRQMAADPLAARAGAQLALTDGGGALL